MIRYGTARQFLDERGTRDEPLPQRHPAPPDNDPEWCDFCDEPRATCGCAVDEAYDHAKDMEDQA